jgi:hypothetical protein
VSKHRTSNGLAVGDRVIDFRGETTGVVTWVETDRGPGKSDKVTVLVDGDGWSQSNYCEVWSKHFACAACRGKRFAACEQESHASWHAAR